MLDSVTRLNTEDIFKPTIIRDNLVPDALNMLFTLINYFLQLYNFCLFPKALNILLHIFVMMSNKNLLLSNYYVQSSIN